MAYSEVIVTMFIFENRICHININLNNKILLRWQSCVTFQLHLSTLAYNLKTFFWNGECTCYRVGKMTPTSRNKPNSLAHSYVFTVNIWHKALIHFDDIWHNPMPSHFSPNKTKQITWGRTKRGFHFGLCLVDFSHKNEKTSHPNIWLFDHLIRVAVCAVHYGDGLLEDQPNWGRRRFLHH